MSDIVFWVHIGRLYYGPVYTYAEACRLTQGEAGGTVSNAVPPEDDTAPLSALKANGHKALAIVPTTPTVSSAFEFTPTGLAIHGKPSLDDWIDFGRVLVGAASRLQWAIGDWINHGKERADWGDMYAQALDAFDLEYRYLCNVSWVAREFDSSRRHEQLTFSHHQEVAGLPVATQEKLLNKAERERLSTRELRDEVSRETGRSVHRDELDQFEGNFDQAIHWLADMKFKHGWERRIRIVIFEVPKPS